MPEQTAPLTIRPDQPLIGIPVLRDGVEVVEYFTSEEAADAALPDRDIELALSAIGSLADVDFEAMLMALDRLRHQSQPTPPITDL